jgi:alanine dehydrogenase
MIIGVPKEIKNNENRVAVTPAGVTEFKKHGHTIYIQSNAGNGSGFRMTNTSMQEQVYYRRLKRFTTLPR